MLPKPCRKRSAANTAPQTPRTGYRVAALCDGAPRLLGAARASAVAAYTRAVSPHRRRTVSPHRRRAVTPYRRAVPPAGHASRPTPPPALPADPPPTAPLVRTLSRADVSPGDSSRRPPLLAQFTSRTPAPRPPRSPPPTRGVALLPVPAQLAASCSCPSRPDSPTSRDPGQAADRSPCPGSHALPGRVPPPRSPVQPSVRTAQAKTIRCRASASSPRP